MSGYTKTRAKLMAQLTFRVSQQLYDTLQEVADAERRTQTDVARALLERGLSLYREDRQLFQPLKVKINDGEWQEVPAMTAMQSLERAQDEEGRRKEAERRIRDFARTGTELSDKELADSMRQLRAMGAFDVVRAEQVEVPDVDANLRDETPAQKEDRLSEGKPKSKQAGKKRA